MIPFLAVAGVAVVFSAQSGCSDPAGQLPGDAGSDVHFGTDGQPQPGQCRDGESIRAIGSLSMCCKDVGPKSAVCFTPSMPRDGEACVTSGATSHAADELKVTSDTCVIEQCTGNRVGTDYFAILAQTKSSLKCATVGGKFVWQKFGAVDAHRVTRTCADLGPQQCSGGYYSGTTIEVRQVNVTASKCSTDGAAEADCPQAEL